MSQNAKAPAGVILYGILFLISALMTFVDGLVPSDAALDKFDAALDEAEAKLAAGGPDEEVEIPSPSVLRVILFTVVALFWALTALALMKLRAWAWFVVTIGFLVSTFANLVSVILNLAEGRSMLGPLFFAVFAAFSLWYLGRYAMECRFRPHRLDAEGAH